MKSQLIQNIIQTLKQNLSSKRFLHVLSVRDTSIHIGQYHACDPEKLILAALLHDFAKHYTTQELNDYCKQYSLELDSSQYNQHALLHGPVASHIASNNYSIQDPGILDPIQYHTTGRANMSIYEAILFIADHCEPNRQKSYASQIIQLAYSDIETSVFTVSFHKLSFLVQNQHFIHPKSLETYNFYFHKKKL